MKKTKKQSGPRRAPALPPARGAAAAAKRSSAQACGARRSPVERGGGLWSASEACVAAVVYGRRRPAELRQSPVELRRWAGGGLRCGGGARAPLQSRAAASVAVVERAEKKERRTGGDWAVGAVTPTGFGPGAGRGGDVFGRGRPSSLEKLDSGFSSGQG
jgi:hypothetical protein